MARRHAYRLLESTSTTAAMIAARARGRFYYRIRRVDTAAIRLEAAIARIARREGDPHERRERAQRIRRDTLVARRLRGGLAPALKHAWGESVD